MKRNTSLLKLGLFLLGGSVVCLIQSALAAPLLYEPFPSRYGNTQMGKNSPSTWTVGSSIGTASPVITNTVNLTYSGLSTTAGSYGVQVSGSTSSGRQAGITFTSQTAGSV